MFKELITVLENNHRNRNSCTVISVTLLIGYCVVIYRALPFDGSLPVERVAIMDYKGKFYGDHYIRMGTRASAS